MDVGANNHSPLPVELTVYNIQGQKIQTLVNKPQLPGSYSVQFDGSNLSSGLYFYRLNAGTFESSKKMLVIK
jgi:hypothetical protein